MFLFLRKCNFFQKDSKKVWKKFGKIVKRYVTLQRQPKKETAVSGKRKIAFE